MVPMGVATYKISNELPEEMKQLLPDPEKIARKLEELVPHVEIVCLLSRKVQ